MKNRLQDAYERAVARPLRPPPEVPADADFATREQHQIMQLAYEMAKRQLAWAERVLAGEGA